MNTGTRALILSGSNYNATVQTFNNSDRPFMRGVYDKWRSLSNDLSSLKSRTVNLPEGLSEGAFCLEMGISRVISGIPGANSSFDCYDFNTKDRIQVKACSVIPDLTSFGPKSVWDKLYFLDFFRQGKWDYSFDIYHIPNSLIYSFKVNVSQTFQQQQVQGRRPRFSIWDGIIIPQKIKPVKTGVI